MEVVVALAVLTLVGAASLAALRTSYQSGAVTEEIAVADNLARNQIEYILSQPYQVPPLSYPTIVPPPGYVVTNSTTEYLPGDTNMEKVVVTITHNGTQRVVLETLRTR